MDRRNNMRAANLLWWGVCCSMFGGMALISILVGLFVDSLRSAGLFPLWTEMSFLIIISLSLLMFLTNTIGTLSLITKVEG
jgi:hypothetical protein